MLDDPVAAGLFGLQREIVFRVGQRLRALSADASASPLEVIQLRGGVASRTPTDPSRPAVLLCTLPMFGSRLLFRGYGSRSRAVDAAMAGTDSLVLLDEAHLAPHLRALLPALAECAPATRNILGNGRSGVRLVSLTATGDAGGDGRFDLGDADKAHSVVRQRLDAAKALEIRLAEGEVARRLADATLELIRRTQTPTSCVVFANTPKTARETFRRLQKQMAKDSASVLLLTGQTREREAERIRARILDPVNGMAADRDPETRRDGHLIVVATQTLEVGADIDAENFVTEACGVRALTQRLGRLNRLGRYTHARAIYLHLPPPKRRKTSAQAGAASDSWPVYGKEPAAVLQRLMAACGDAGNPVVNLPPRSVAALLGPPEDDPGRAPEVLPAILWEWTKTTTPPDGEAPVEPYFSGIAGAQYAVSLIWRAHVPESRDRLWPRATDREAVDVPIREVRGLLGDEKVARLASDGVTVEQVSGTDVRPGDQLVLSVDRGFLDAFGWNPESTGPVVDVSLAGRGLPLDAGVLKRLCGVALHKQVETALGNANGDGDVDSEERSAAVQEILAVVRATLPAGWDRDEWAELTDALSGNVVEARREVPRLLVHKPKPESRSGELDETSLGDVSVELDRHGAAVGSRARSVARRIGVPLDLVEVIEHAGRLHDIGKADQRFQRWLDPNGAQTTLVAKSDTPRHLWERTRSAAGWPRGGRHEELSARLVRAWLQADPAWGDHLGRALLLHLVISHHGKGRPLVLPVSDGTHAQVSMMLAGQRIEVSADLGGVDWTQPARFRLLTNHFGPWGLALLEAIVVSADHAVSAGATGLVESAE